MRHSRPYLFSDYDLRKVIENQIKEMASEVSSIDDNRLLNTSDDDMVSYLTKKYSIEPIVLDESNITVDQTEKDIKVRDYGEEFVRKGTSNIFYVPYSGDKDLFMCQASTFTHSPPIATVNEGELVMSFDSTNHDAEKLKNEFTRELEEIKRHIEWVNKDVEAFNSSVTDKARQILSDRKKRVLANMNLVSTLGFPLRQRDNAPRTYSIPSVKRKPPVRPPVSTSKSFKPEPALDDKEYEHILSVIDNMVLVMERSPNAFSGMGEEDLRQHFLVQLNGHYEGQATGETFNFDGKTDILIRTGGRNIFIGECKFWRGPKGFTDTIDQILGYSSWRDVKTSLLIFNRNKSLTSVLEKIPNLIEKHNNFKRFAAYTHESGWRAIFKQRDDESRELTITVHVYEVPGNEEI